MQLDDLKILICDDSILARKQMKDIINSIGSPTIIEAANGQLAIDMYKEHKPKSHIYRHCNASKGWKCRYLRNYGV